MSFFRSYFDFNKTERFFIVFFVLLILSIFFIPYIYKINNNVVNKSQFEERINHFDSLLKNAEKTDNVGVKNKILNRSFKLFQFNPNNLSVDKWRELGLNEWQIKIIKNYETKGGRFYKKEDLKKIYSLSNDDYIRLKPYINIPIDIKENKKPAVISYSDKKNDCMVEINSADSCELVELKGIGPVFARLIIKYRERLGGFYSKEQLKEVFNMDNDRYAMFERNIKVDKQLIKKININNSGFYELKRHPYIKYENAIKIMNCKRFFGRFYKIEDLYKCTTLNDTTISKIAPYIEF
ncbi:MAG: helix-hairpin-helix domain-containing protein [Bacteroidales bacterium]|nr:helix-hairpin-helix domain-containing protein [Bacteroidales bacterium]